MTKDDVPSSSISSCDQANIIEENTWLKDEFAKSTIPICEKNVNDLLSIQRSNNDKMGLGYVSTKKKKKKKKKKKENKKKKKKKKKKKRKK
jgi:hypothetical protein